MSLINKNNYVDDLQSTSLYDENQNIKGKINFAETNCETTMPHHDSTSTNHKFNQLQKELNEVNSKINQFLTDFSKTSLRPSNVKQASKPDMSNPWAFLNMTTKSYTTAKTSADELPDRIFVKRNSLLTEMFKINHIRTIRNIFTSIMILVALQVVFDDLMDQGKVNLNFDLIFWCFGNFQKVLYTWAYMQVSTAILVYFCFHYWSKNRLIYLAKHGRSMCSDDKTNKMNIHLTKKLNLFDSIWFIGFICYLIAFLVMPASVVINNKLPPASALIILLEQIRMLMKSYAFVRSNIPRALKNGQIRLSNSEEMSSSETEKSRSSLNYKKLLTTSEQVDSEDEDLETVKSKLKEEELNEKKLCPDFSNYLYFLFAPTFIYRDTYPRNTRIKWQNVFNHLAQILGSIMYTYYILARYCIPVFKHFNTEHVTVRMFISSILACHLSGTLLLLILFYGILHCWLNAFAEMLRFADRMFYKDWWNSTNYSNYYRTWNVVVHDWLYNYIYKDLYMLLGKKNRVSCQFAIFLISAFFHEYVLTLAFGFFYPVLFLMFGAIGFACMFIKSDKNSNFWNFITWCGLQIGLGGLMCLYSIEWYARQNCAQTIESDVLDYMLPRSFTCGLNKPAQDITISPIRMDL